MLETIGLFGMLLILGVTLAYSLTTSYHLRKLQNVMSETAEGLTKLYHDQNAEILHLQEYLKSISEETPEELNEYQVVKQARESSFDARILQIKNELAKQYAEERVGVSAEELHPDVKNVPHTDIPVDRNYEEVAE